MCIIIDDDMEGNSILLNKIPQNQYFSPKSFSDTNSAMKFLSGNTIDLAFVSLCSKNIDYASIIHFIKRRRDKAVIFLIGTDDSQSAEVYKRQCDYFIKKPYNGLEINHCLERFELLSKRICKNVYVRAFGRFDVFVKGVPIDFHNAKAKELFALCIDHHGGSVTMNEAIDKLWPERDYDEKVKRLYRKALISITKTLAENNISEVFVKSRGSCNIKKELIECDYFNFIEDPKMYYDLFQGEYLFDYSWAEETLARFNYILA